MRTNPKSPDRAQGGEWWPGGRSGRTAASDTQGKNRPPMGTPTIHPDEWLRQVRELAPLPASAVRLSQMLNDPRCDLQDLSELIAYDQALTLKLLRAANSAASSSVERISDVREAVIRMGTGRVMTLAVAAGAKALIQASLPAYGLDEGDLWRHSVAAAVAAEVAPRFCQVDIPQEAFTAALLHDVGKLVLGRFLRPDLATQLAESIALDAPARLKAETRLLGRHHGEIGGMVATHWNLPPRVVAGIAHHHTPDEGRDVVCDVTHVANHIAKRIEAGLDGRSFDETPDAEVLDRLGMDNSSVEDFWMVAIGRYAEVKLHYQAV